MKATQDATEPADNIGVAASSGFGPEGWESVRGAENGY